MSLNILEQVAAASGKTEKFNLLKSNNKNKELAELLDAVFNYNRKFFVNKFDMPVAVSSHAARHADFIKVLNLLENRIITGNAAKRTVEEFFEYCDEFHQGWYAKILRKDLKAGFSAETAVKAGFTDIPLFDLKLAKDKDSCKKLSSLLAEGGFRSIKYDGYRLVAEIENGTCTLLTRAGHVYENFPQINKTLEELFPTGKHMLDGEIMSDDFQSMQKSAFASKRGTTVGDMKFMVFDSVPWDEWESKKFKTKASKRFSDLKTWHAANPHPLISLVEHEYGVWTDTEMIEYRDRQITAGYEGGMWEPDVPYYLGKKTNKMIKYKLMLSQDCEIIGFYEGSTGTDNEGRLGGFIVKQENGLTCRGDGRVTDVDRQYIWDNQSEFLGRIGEFKYQELTPDKIMRFPKFFRWRDDK